MHWAGIVGTPGDMVNVRMQNDIKLPKEQRRKYVSISQNYFIRQKYFLRPWNYFSYNHAIDGLIRVSREEGVKKLFNGVDWATARAVLMTIGQLCFYDQIKALLLGTPYFSDNLITHFTSSLCAVRRRKYLRWKYYSYKFTGSHRDHHDPTSWCSQDQSYECQAWRVQGSTGPDQVHRQGRRSDGILQGEIFHVTMIKYFMLCSRDIFLHSWDWVHKQF